MLIINDRLKRCLIRSIPYLIFIIGIFILLLPQIKSRAFFAGVDSWFHMNQYYDTATQIRTGHFSYFLTMYGFHGVGRIVNAVYGAGFMYLNGLLLLIAHTWYHFEIIQSFLVLMATCIFFYILCVKNYINRALGTILSLIYMMTMPVISYVTDQEYIGIGAMLFPLVMIQGTQMARKHQIAPISLGIVMAITIQTHALTTVAGSVCLIPFFVYAWYFSVHRFHLWMHLFEAIGLTIILTGNIWGAMLDILPQRLIPPVPQGYPTTAGSLAFTHFMDFGILGYCGSLLLISLVLVGSLSLFYWPRTNGVIHTTYLLGLFATWFSSLYFPWRILLAIYPAYLYQIQLPKRFVSIAFCCLLLTFGMLFNQYDSRLINIHNHYVMPILLALIMLIPLSFSYSHANYEIDQAVKIYQSKDVVGFNAFCQYDLTKAKRDNLRTEYHTTNNNQPLDIIHQDTPDYLPTQAIIHTYNEYRHNGSYSAIQKELYIKYRPFHFTEHKIHHGVLTLKWYQKHAHNEDLPMIKYNHTQVTLNDHIIHPELTRIGSVKSQNVPAGHNVLAIQYNTPLWLILLIIISVLSWMALVISVFMLFLTKKTDDPNDNQPRTRMALYHNRQS